MRGKFDYSSYWIHMKNPACEKYTDMLHMFENSRMFKKAVVETSGNFWHLGIPYCRHSRIFLSDAARQFLQQYT
jgi:hypothetical protein